MSDAIFQPLQGYRILSLAVNVPGPVAAARLHRLGAKVTKVEPPAGDPLARVSHAWYEALVEGQEVIPLDLKEPHERAQLDARLARSDLLLTASRLAALERLSLDWRHLHEQFPSLSQVAIIGYPADDEHKPGHDLTYLASLGLLEPPRMPRTLLADLAGAEQTVSAALSLLLARERGLGTGYREVSLAEAAATFAAPLQHDLSAPDGLLGGGLPSYNLYPTRDGWIALAALELHFWYRLQKELELDNPTYSELAAVFNSRTAREWEAWAVERDLPLRMVQPSH